MKRATIVIVKLTKRVIKIYTNDCVLRFCRRAELEMLSCSRPRAEPRCMRQLRVHSRAGGEVGPQ
jgi:hypothetical protein